MTVVAMEKREASAAAAPTKQSVDQAQEQEEVQLHPIASALEPEDPFTHELRLSGLQWIRTVVLTVFLVPVRLVLIFLCVIAAWACSAVAIRGVSKAALASRPLLGWRLHLRRCASWLGRRCANAAGFIPVTVVGRQATAAEAPVLVVAPHSTFFDGLAVFYANGAESPPYLVSREENRALPLLGKCIECAQALFVSREDPESRQKTVKEIVRRSACSEEGWPQLVIFPEGSTSNRRALMTFKPGGFYPGKPVQPVILRYRNSLDTVTWTWNQSHGALSVLWLTLAQPFTRASLEFLPVYYPSAAEKSDAKLFAANVRDVMCAALGVPASDVTFEEAKAKFGKKRKRTKSRTKKD